MITCSLRSGESHVHSFDSPIGFENRDHLVGFRTQGPKLRTVGRIVYFFFSFRQFFCFFIVSGTAFSRYYTYLSSRAWPPSTKKAARPPLVRSDRQSVAFPDVEFLSSAKQNIIIITIITNK